MHFSRKNAKNTKNVHNFGIYYSVEKLDIKTQKGHKFERSAGAYRT